MNSKEQWFGIQLLQEMPVSIISIVFADYSKQIICRIYAL